MSSPAKASAPSTRPTPTTAARPGAAALIGAPKSEGSGTKKLLIPVVIVAVIVIGFVAVNALSTASSTLASSGTTWNLPVGTAQVVSFSLSKTAGVGASFSSTGPIDIYAMTHAEYEAYQANGTTSGVFWSSGPIDDSSFSVTLGSGSWYLVFVSAAPYQGVTITLTNALTATTA